MYIGILIFNRVHQEDDKASISDCDLEVDSLMLMGFAFLRLLPLAVRPSEHPLSYVDDAPLSNQASGFRHAFSPVLPNLPGCSLPEIYAEFIATST